LPKYDFSCINCGIIEIEHSIHVPHPARCPNCNEPIVRHIVDVPVIEFISNGGGVDDWASKVITRQEPTSDEADVPYQ